MLPICCKLQFNFFKAQCHWEVFIEKIIIVHTEFVEAKEIEEKKVFVLQYPHI